MDRLTRDEILTIISDEGILDAIDAVVMLCACSKTRAEQSIIRALGARKYSILVDQAEVGLE